MLWDLFCRVIDNYGDIGVCWRLAADLGSRGESVRLWADDLSALAWMAPAGACGVEPRPWCDAADAADAADWPNPGDVVIEAFGCELPEAFVARIAAAARVPVWINLEYLSAEDYALSCHGLPSPQATGAGRGLRKWFYYPGFVPASGGLLREPGLIEQQAGFDAAAWLRTIGVERRPGERLVSLFCYRGAPVVALALQLADLPTLLLATPGTTVPPDTAAVRSVALPWLDQAGYDRLLWACELNFVRGEDSFVRAQWAGVPFVWQIYPQHDAAHEAKLDAFLAAMLSGADGTMAAQLRAFWRGWNALSPQLPALPAFAEWQGLARRWRDSLLPQPDLGTRLIRFVAERR